MWPPIITTLVLGGGALLMIRGLMQQQEQQEGAHPKHWDRMLSRMMRIRKIQTAYHEYGSWLKQFEPDLRENIQTNWRPADWKKNKKFRRTPP